MEVAVGQVCLVGDELVEGGFSVARRRIVSGYGRWWTRWYALCDCAASQVITLLFHTFIEKKKASVVFVS